ncbi:MAG TPA: methionine--tRNA ligase [Gemmatimonadales bacterium]|nr:methionine--tRNA ligase [Gemmatimonadales bacterium]
MSERFYLTTAIDYSNGDPHIGHAFEKIGADCLARYLRLRGTQVHFLIGMDEHGKKVAQAAAAQNLSPQEFVNGIARRFADTWQTLGISHDQFMRTTSAGHRTGVRALIERIFARNPDDLYEQTYEGWYCVGCELFKRDSEIAEGRCTLHPTRTLEWTVERNWFFRLTRYAPFIGQLLNDQADFLRPESRRNEILGLLDQGLEDISVSRSGLTWAVPFPRPLSTGEQQGTWVWFDALPNYLTATGFPDPGYEQRWPAQLHVIGKDIIRLHCVIWPAMLRAADLPLPRSVWAHGFVSFSGARFSKSAGTTISLDQAIARHGPDPFRYFLLREVPWNADGNFTWERFDARYEADLANGLGNLASRVLAMTARYRAGVVPDAGDPTDLDAAGDQVIADYQAAMDQYLLHEGAAHAWRLVDRANGFVEETAPWNLAKRKDDIALDQTLAALARALVRITLLVCPFMPKKTQEIWSALGLPGVPGEAGWGALQAPRVGGLRVTKPPPVFPKSDIGNVSDITT